MYQDKTLGKLRSNSINSDIQRLEVKLHLVREAHGRLKFQKDKYFSPFTGSKNLEAGSVAVGPGEGRILCRICLPSNLFKFHAESRNMSGWMWRLPKVDLPPTYSLEEITT